MDVEIVRGILNEMKISELNYELEYHLVWIVLNKTVDFL